MLRSPGELIAAPSAFLQRLLRSFLRPDDNTRQERDAFVRLAKVALPWLTPSRLTYLAYFSSHTATPSMTRARARGWRFFNFSFFETLQNGAVQLRFFKPEPVWIRKVIRSEGKERVLHIPNVPLKHLQRFVLRKYLATIRPDDAAFGFEPTRSRRAHALNHCKKAVVVRLDIRNFFPSVALPNVTPLFRECGFKTQFAETLARIVTFKGRLPQGAPTSPKIADLVARPLDAVLRRIAKDHRWFYSRYADDLCFSSARRRSSRSINDLIIQISAAVRDAGFRLNRSKTKVMRRHGRQQIVGVVVNNHSPAAPRERHRLLRALAYRAERYGLLAEGLRYRERLRADGHDVSLREGKHGGELVRRDRRWPYARQVPHLPRSLRDQIIALPNEHWTAVADFWHFLCGQVGELASLQPQRSAFYVNLLRRATLTGSASVVRVPQSLEVKEQALVDRWRRIADLVAEVNVGARGFEYPLIALLPLTPADQRRTADSEADLQICLNTIYRSLLDRISQRYKKAIGEWLVERVNSGFRIAKVLRNYFHHGHRGQEESRTADAHKAFRDLIGKTFPETREDWYQSHIVLLDRVLRDLETLLSWRPSGAAE